MSESDCSCGSEASVSEGIIANIVSVSQKADSIKNSRPKPRTGRPSKPKSTKATVSRFYKYLESSQERTAKRRKEKEEEELRMCTFRPSINSHRSPRRSYDQFYKSMMSFVEQKDKKMRKSIEDREASEEIFSFCPKISENSQRMLKTNTYYALPSHERLFNKNKEDVKYLICQQGTLTDDFVPLINKKSREISRDSPCSDLLYQDALRRQQQHKERVQSPSGQPFTSQNSQEILIKRFLMSFESVRQSLDISSNVNYMKFQLLLAGLGFVEYNVSDSEQKLIIELWEILRNKQNTVHIEDFKTALMGLMGYYQPWMSKTNFQLDQCSVQEFHLKFSLLFERKRTQNSKEKPRQTQPKTTQKPPLHTFRETEKIKDVVQDRNKDNDNQKRKTNSSRRSNQKEKRKDTEKNRRHSKGLSTRKVLDKLLGKDDSERNKRSNLLSKEYRKPPFDDKKQARKEEEVSEQSFLKEDTVGDLPVSGCATRRKSKHHSVSPVRYSYVFLKPNLDDSPKPRFTCPKETEDSKKDWLNHSRSLRDSNHVQLIDK